MLNKITGPFREFGPAAGLLYAIDRVLSSLSPRLRLHVYELTVQPIQDGPLVAGRAGRGIEVREIRDGDPELARMPVRPGIIPARFAQQAVCLGAWRKGECIGYMWFCRREYDEDEVRCTYVIGPVEQSVFDFDFYLFPEHRMGTAFVGLWNGANQFLHEHGIRQSFGRMTRFNLASRNAHRHLGMKVVGRAMFLQLGPVEILFSTLAPWFRVTVTGRVRIALTPEVLGRDR